MSTDKQVYLEFRCPIQLNQLQKRGRNYHCSNCSKNLIDFRNISLDKVYEQQQKSFNKTCGIFNNSQLSTQFLKSSLATLVVTSIVSYHTYSQEIEVEIEDKTLIECSDSDIFIGNIIEKYAEPVGGIKKFFDALSKKIEYPQNISKYGKVFIEFEVDTTGKMLNFKVVRGLEKNTNIAVLNRLITLLSLPNNGEKRYSQK